MMNRNTASILSRIFSNKIFLIIFSVIISCVIWFSINTGDYAETSYVVRDIPITINLPDEAQKQGLEVFNGGGLTGSVTVTGNRALIGRLSSNDIQIVPEQTDSLTSAGSYTLSLVAKKTDGVSNFSIDSVSPASVFIKLDRTRNISQKITTNYIDYKIPTGYYGNVFLSDQNVSISGPESEIKQIDQVVIQDTIEDELTETMQKKYKVKLLDSFGEELKSSESITISPSEVTATISVLKMKNVEVDMSFKNEPKGIELSEYCTPDNKQIAIAGEEKYIEDIERVNTEAIDFSTLKNIDYNLTRSLDLPDKCIDINNVKSVNAQINLANMEEKNIRLTNFDITGLDNSYNGKVTTSAIDITVYGTKKQISKISALDINAVVDLSGTKISTGTKEMQLTISTDFDGCWIYGTYKVVVDISQ